MVEDEQYSGREQTYVKHLILQEYLKAFVSIVGQHWDAITYVDCFAGPWNSRSPDHKDTSFRLALDQVLEARANLEKKEIRKRRGRLKLRCFFVEPVLQAYEKLKAFVDSVHGHDDVFVATKNAQLGDAVSDIVRFAEDEPRGFTFVFIDPTGWTGFSMEMIRPLLQLRSSEVMVNFMTDYIRRFVEVSSPERRQEFTDLFGSSDFLAAVKELKGTERDEALVRFYGARLRAVGGFSHACNTIVLDPLKDRTKFHLLYLTRDRKGVEVFKDAECKAMQQMERVRALAQQEARRQRSGQFEFFSAEEMHGGHHLEELTRRYRRRARKESERCLDGARKCPTRRPGIWRRATRWSKQATSSGGLRRA